MSGYSTHNCISGASYLGSIIFVPVVARCFQAFLAMSVAVRRFQAFFAMTVAADVFVDNFFALRSLPVGSHRSISASFTPAFIT